MTSECQFFILLYFALLDRLLSSLNTPHMHACVRAYMHDHACMKTFGVVICFTIAIIFLRGRGVCAILAYTPESKVSHRRGTGVCLHVSFSVLSDLV